MYDQKCSQGLCQKINFSRPLQYNFSDLSKYFDAAYGICIPPVLPSEMCEMCFEVGCTGVCIVHDCIVSKSQDHSFLHPGNDQLCYIRDGFLFQKRKLPSIFRKKYGIVDMLNPRCYYHWVVNDFPRILLCYQAGYKNIIILDQGKIDIDSLTNFQKEFLDLLPGLKFFSLKNDIKTRSLCIPILPDEYGGEDVCIGGVHIYDYYTHRMTRYVLREIPALFGLEDNNKKRRLKIQRKGENSRDPKNREELNDFLQKKWNFEIIYLEDHSVKEQMQMMRDSEIVVGAHGSGLVNFIAADERSVLVEYGDETYYEHAPNYSGKNRTKTKNFFHFMCEVSGHKYRFFPIKNDKIDLRHLDNILKKELYED